MQLIIRNRVVTTPIKSILLRIKNELGDGRFRDIVARSGRDNVLCTCPFHKDGFEKNPSMNIYQGDAEKLEYGTTHCFTCGYKASLPRFIGDVFGEDRAFGEEWLLDRFGGDFIEEALYLPPLEPSKPANSNTPLNPAILEQYKYKHPYMYQRGLTDPIIEYFQIGYDKEQDAITFPVWDEHGNLVAITKRSVKTKNFYIPENLDKPVYLLNVVKAAGITTVVVAESQLNTLNSWKFGYPAIGLFGTGSEKQLEILKRSGIRHYILMFDGDEAGRKGATRFKNFFADSVLITDVHMYWGKDISDLSEKEFHALLKRYLG